MKVLIRTLGCRLNQQESEAVAAAFTHNNIFLTSRAEEADLAVINTCTVTSKADRKNRQGINSLVKMNIPVLVMGCYAAVGEEEIRRLGEKILIIPREKKSFTLMLPTLLATFSKTHTDDLVSFIKNALENFSRNTDDFDFFCTEFSNHTRGFLKIQDGCNHGCTYCRTVIARGKSRSLAPETALERIQALEKNGIGEVMITGVNLAQYEKNGWEFPDLIQYLCDGSEKINFRISSFHPEKITPKFLKMAENPRVMPHFHLSVQSGSDDVLKRMARPYDSKTVEEAVKNLRQVKDNPFIACDIIVGFPGEREVDFRKTLELCQRCDFAWVHQFAFSPRPGTKAFNMNGTLSAETMKSRQNLLQSQSLERKFRYCKSCEGKIFRTVVEKNRTDGRAVTENFLHIHVANLTGDQGGKILPVKFVQALNLTGREGEMEGEGQWVGDSLLNKN